MNNMTRREALQKTDRMCSLFLREKPLKCTFIAVNASFFFNLLVFCFPVSVTKFLTVKFKIREIIHKLLKNSISSDQNF